MIITAHSIWLVGKPRDILDCLAILAAKYDYLAQVLAVPGPLGSGTGLDNSQHQAGELD